MLTAAVPASVAATLKSSQWYSVDHKTGVYEPYSEALSAMLEQACAHLQPRVTTRINGVTYTIDIARGVQIREQQATEVAAHRGGAKSVFRFCRRGDHVAPSSPPVDEVEDPAVTFPPWVDIAPSGEAKLLPADSCRALEAAYTSRQPDAMVPPMWKVALVSGRRNVALPFDEKDEKTGGGELELLRLILAVLCRSVRKTPPSIWKRVPNGAWHGPLWTLRRRGEMTECPLSRTSCDALEEAKRADCPCATMIEVGAGVLTVDMNAMTASYAHAAASEFVAKRYDRVPPDCYAALWYVIHVRDSRAAVDMDYAVMAWLEYRRQHLREPTAHMLHDGLVCRVAFASMTMSRAGPLGMAGTMPVRRLQLLGSSGQLDGHDAGDDIAELAAQDSDDDKEDASAGVSEAQADAWLESEDREVFVSVDPRTNVLVPYAQRHSRQISRAIDEGRGVAVLRIGKAVFAIDVNRMAQSSLEGHRREVRRLPPCDLPVANETASWSSVDPLTRTLVPYPRDVSRLIELAYTKGWPSVEIPPGMAAIDFGEIDLVFMIQRTEEEDKEAAKSVEGATADDGPLRGVKPPKRFTTRAVRRLGGVKAVARLDVLCADGVNMTFHESGAMDTACTTCGSEIPAAACRFVCECPHRKCVRCEACSKQVLIGVVPLATAARRSRWPQTDITAALAQSCSEKELKALQLCHTRAARLSAEARPRLLLRLSALGIATSAQLIEDYLAQAPIIVHVKLEKEEICEKLLEDTHFRNQFETSLTGGHFDPTPGGTRVQWESVQFDKAYDGSPGFRRPKYGVLNFTNDVRGVKEARQYGTCWLLLKNVAHRCTLTAEDSGSKTLMPMGTLDHAAHIFETLTDDELRTVARLASGDAAPRWANSAVQTQYKEVQIHGEIRLSRDIAAVGVSDKAARQPYIMARIRHACQLHGWELVVIPTGDIDAASPCHAALASQLPCSAS